MKTHLSHVTFTLCFLGLVMLGGCDSSRSHLHHIKGTVTHQGQPVAGLFIVFTPDDDTVAADSMGMSNENGEFEMMVGSAPGVFPGPHTVVVSDPMALQGGKSSDEPAFLAVIEKYAPGVSTYKLTIDEDNDQLELKLD